MTNMIQLVLCGLLTCGVWPYAQQPAMVADAPAVFQLSKADDYHDHLRSEHPVTLLSVFDNNTQEAFVFWRSYSQTIQALARANHKDGPGTQIWVKVYWDRNGKLNHIGYHSGNSRIGDDAWDKLFESLIAASDARGTWPNGFYHYGSVRIN